jgi:hypothetical protein
MKIYQNDQMEQALASAGWLIDENWRRFSHTAMDMVRNLEAQLHPLAPGRGSMQRCASTHAMGALVSDGAAVPIVARRAVYFELPNPAACTTGGSRIEHTLQQASQGAERKRSKGEHFFDEGQCTNSGSSTLYFTKDDWKGVTLVEN